MYINITGCLVSLILFLLVLCLLKELWWLIVGIAVIIIAAYWGRKIYFLIKEERAAKQSEYNPQMGEVFKVCPYCNSKMKVTETICPNCKRALN